MLYISYISSSLKYLANLDNMLRHGPFEASQSGWGRQPSSHTFCCVWDTNEGCADYGNPDHGLSEARELKLRIDCLPRCTGSIEVYAH